VIDDVSEGVQNSLLVALFVAIKQLQQHAIVSEVQISRVLAMAHFQFLHNSFTLLKFHSRINIVACDCRSVLRSSVVGGILVDLNRSMNLRMWTPELLRPFYVSFLIAITIIIVIVVIVIIIIIVVVVIVVIAAWAIFFLLRARIQCDTVEVIFFLV